MGRLFSTESSQAPALFTSSSSLSTGTQHVASVRIRVERLIITDIFGRLPDPAAQNASLTIHVQNSRLAYLTSAHPRMTRATRARSSDSPLLHSQLRAGQGRLGVIERRLPRTIPHETQKLHLLNDSRGDQQCCDPHQYRPCPIPVQRPLMNGVKTRKTHSPSTYPVPAPFGRPYVPIGYIMSKLAHR